MSRLSVFVLLCSLIWVAGCGGGNGVSNAGNNTVAPSGPNVAAITAGGAPPTNPANVDNGLFTSVTVCLPGTSNCATVNGILVDTGSFGLRIIQSALPTGFTLPQQTDGSGNPIAECTEFADGFSWGPIVTADMTISSEKASSMPMQLINGSFSTIPTSCSSVGTEEDDVTSFGANGVIGVGNFAQDCGDACTFPPGGGTNPGIYYTCPTTGCIQTTEAVAAQVVNPVALFSTDNNGVVVELPSISTSGATSANGSLVFGIGTQSNNGLGSATILDLDPNTGNFNTIFQGNTLSDNSFVDSGSNGLFFPDSTLATCTLGAGSGAFTAYCPSSLTSLSATNQGMNGTTITTNFDVINITTLNGPAFSDFAAPDSFGLTGFDWGLPFFFGRNVFIAIAGASTPGGAGPYTAYSAQ